MKPADGRSEAISEIGEILAGGYLRLLAQMCEKENQQDVTANLSGPSSLYPLDNTGHQSDVSMAGSETNLFQGKGLE